jgi:hypothetical protein
MIDDSICDDGLTQSALLDLLSCHGKCRDQLDQYLDNRFHHGRRRMDRHIDFESFEKVTDRFQ